MARATKKHKKVETVEAKAPVFVTPIVSKSHTATYSGVTYQIETLTAVSADGTVYSAYTWTLEDGTINFERDWHKSGVTNRQTIDFPKLKRNKEGKVISHGPRVVRDSWTPTPDEFHAHLLAEGWEVAA